jgi:hypothetical protein
MNKCAKDFMREKEWLSPDELMGNRIIPCSSKESVLLFKREVNYMKLIHNYPRVAGESILVALLAVVVLANSAQSATRAWAGNDGTNPTYWDIGTTNNWDGGGASFANFDDVSFTNAGIGTTVDLQSSVSPNSTIIDSTTNAYTFNGGDIANGTISVSGSAVHAKLIELWWWNGCEQRSRRLLACEYWRTLVWHRGHYSQYRRKYMV